MGDYLEFGVYFGSSIARMHEAQRLTGMRTRIYGFDSFDGLPDNGGPFYKGQFYASKQDAWRYLASKGLGKNDVTLVPGLFEDTCTPETAQRLGITHAGVIMMDADLYASTATALRFVRPLIGERAVIFFDEFALGGTDGERRAFEEFLAHDEFDSEEMPTYRVAASVFKLTRKRAL